MRVKRSFGQPRALAAALAFANVLSMACADLAQTYPMSEVLDWERASQMQMSVSGADGDVIPFLYAVIPLTTDLGLNESQTDRGVGTLASPAKSPRPLPPLSHLPLYPDWYEGWDVPALQSQRANLRLTRRLGDRHRRQVDLCRCVQLRQR